jgi:hypothetical protein
MRRTLLTVAVSAGVLVWTPAGADTRTRCGDGNICNATIEGNISKADVLAFQKLAKKVASNPPSTQALIVTLNSKGGDVRAAIEIGQIVRRIPKSAAVVARDDICASACVFVLAGAVLRSVSGKVAIHRPYSMTTEEKKYQDRQREFSALSRAAKDYLEQMNVPLALYDEMMQIPPQAIKVLSDAELQRFGLDRNDPVYQDLLDSDIARSYGLSKTDYLSRKARAFQICQKVNAPAPKTLENARQAYELEQQCTVEVMNGTRNN